jgi:(E)-4-hydroxy-3-methylbut-2-enyl-diphosphate synthase
MKGISVLLFDISLLNSLKNSKNVVLQIHSENNHGMAALRRVFVDLINGEITVPVVIERSYVETEVDRFMLYSSTDIGGLLIDGLGDGVMLSNRSTGFDNKIVNQTAFGILQAARTRITKTEYISCPSCGRTLFDLQETTAMIRKRTDHLKGVKIGIMGCIVNGPGEMADADYGYVGSGVGKITLYKGKEVIKRGVPSERALDELIELIKEDGRWTDPANN